MLVRLLTMYVAVTTVVYYSKLAGSEHLRTVPEARRAEIRALLQAAATATTATTATNSAGESSTSTAATAAPTTGGSTSSSSTAAAVTGGSGSVSAAVADDLKRQVRECQSIVY
jgi:hypothetical protein